MKRSTALNAVLKSSVITAQYLCFYTPGDFSRAQKVTHNFREACEFIDAHPEKKWYVSGKDRYNSREVDGFWLDISLAGAAQCEPVHKYSYARKVLASHARRQQRALEERQAKRYTRNYLASEFPGRVITDAMVGEYMEEGC